jgi:hypothetical protein
VLLRLALEPQRSKADVRQREDISAAIGFQMLFVDELATDALDLPFQRDLGVVQVDRWPDEALCFAFAQAEDQDQDPQWVEGVTIGVGGLQEPPRLVYAPGLAALVVLRAAGSL